MSESVKSKSVFVALKFRGDPFFFLSLSLGVRNEEGRFWTDKELFSPLVRFIPYLVSEPSKSFKDAARTTNDDRPHLTDLPHVQTKGGKKGYLIIDVVVYSSPDPPIYLLCASDQLFCNGKQRGLHCELRRLPRQMRLTTAETDRRLDQERRISG